MVVTSQWGGTSNSAATAWRSNAKSPHVRAYGETLDGHLRYGLTEVVRVELRVLPVRSFDETMRQVGYEKAAGGGHGPCAGGDVGHQPAVVCASAPAHQERPGF